MMVLSAVVLPAPFRPTRQTTSRSRTSSETRRRMWLAWMNTSISLTASILVPPPADHHVHHPGVSLDLGGRGVGQHLALVERDDAVRVAEDDVHVVLDLDDGAQADAPGRAHEDLHDGVLVGGAHTAGRLVEQDDLGTQREGRGDVQELLVALRQRA